MFNDAINSTQTLFLYYFKLFHPFNILKQLKLIKLVVVVVSQIMRMRVAIEQTFWVKMSKSVNFVII